MPDQYNVTALTWYFSSQFRQLRMHAILKFVPLSFQTLISSSCQTFEYFISLFCSSKISLIRNARALNS